MTRYLWMGVLMSAAGSVQSAEPAAHYVTLTLGEPVVVARAPAEVRNWGPWQFPKLERLADGRLHVSYHIEADSATAYGKPEGHAYSADGGKTWTPAAALEGAGGLLLANGDRLRIAPQRAVPLTELKLPPAQLKLSSTYLSHPYQLYSREQLPQGIKSYRLLRLKKGGTTWQEEFPAVRMSDDFAMATEGVLALSFFDWNIHWQVAPDGSVLMIGYPPRRIAKEHQAKLGEFKWGMVLLRSTDHGHSWNMLSEIPYQPPEPPADANWARREGFTEPDFCFLPDKSMLCLLRTEDGGGTGPLYFCKSPDQGKSWSKPQLFDDLGVWPVLLTLKNGITLAAYGRPGFYVRACADPAGLKWDARTEIVKAGTKLQDTCSYGDLIAADEHTALVVYTDFNWPDETGVKRKTVLFRSVRAQLKK